MSQLHAAIQLSNGEQLMHFSHANGYAPQTYARFLEPLKRENSVIASIHRPLWQPSPHPHSIRSWRQFGADVERLVVSLSDPVLSVGHSMGAAANVMAAASKPERFRGLVLVEPALVPANYYAILRWFRPLIQARYPLIRRTLNRVDSWENRENTFAHFRPKPVFKRFSDDVLWDYINHGTFEDSQGKTRLNYSKEWEAHCYLLADNIWRDLKSLKMPVLVVRGARSDTFARRTYQALRRQCPHFDYLEIPNTGHLLPFEEPDRLAAEITTWCQAL